MVRLITKNKSQFALEFILIIAFMLLLFLGFFTVISSRILEAKENENKQIAEGLANLVFDEVKLANSVADGYSRTFTLPKRVKGISYNISILDNRELVANYLDNEYVIFLPDNVEGDVDIGLNEIDKTNDRIYIAPITT